MIPHGQNTRLYLYTDFTVDGLAWAANPHDWRMLTRHSGTPIRVVPRNTDMPPGYVQTGPLACHPIERRTAKDFIRFLSPD
jgi:hypothetical protein